MEVTTSTINRMFSLSDICSLCLERSKKFSLQTDIDSSVRNIIQYIIPEYMLEEYLVPKAICDDCLNTLTSILKFRQKCLQNIITFKEHVQKLTQEFETQKRLSPTVINISHQTQPETFCKNKNNIESSETITNLKSEIFETEDDNQKCSRESQNIEQVLIKIENTDDDFMEEEEVTIEEEEWKYPKISVEEDCLETSSFQLDKEKQGKHYSEIISGVTNIQDIIERTVESNDSWREDTTSTSRSRWKKSDPSKWKKNIQRRQKLETKAPKPIYCSTCRFKCAEKISEDSRKIICNEYWSADFNGRKDFILQRVESHEKRRSTPGSKRLRKDSKSYFFELDNVRNRVCRDFFIKTLCISKEVVDHAFQFKGEDGSFASNDQRGKKQPYNKTKDSDVEIVKNHIQTFLLIESQYPTSKLSIARMHHSYMKFCEKDNLKPVSLITYRRIFYSKYKTINSAK